MPRTRRLDFPGALHHVCVRGVAGTPIFLDDADREAFVGCLGDVLRATRTRAYAWSLMTNHAHIVLRTGALPLAKVMQKLLTRYAVHFNKRHRREGHLFQNRYKAILGQDERYFMALVRYVHLNPVRGGTVGSLDELSGYPWSGHRALLTGRCPDWQDVGAVLGRFATDPGVARSMYVEFLAAREKVDDAKLAAMLERGAKVEMVGERGGSGEERILGRGEFVEGVLREVEGRDRRRAWLGKRLSPADVIARAAEAAGVRARDVRGPRKRPAVARARHLACKWLVEDLGLPGVRVAEMLGISQTAVSRGVERGRNAERKLGASLDGENGKMASTSLPKE